MNTGLLLVLLAFPILIPFIAKYFIPHKVSWGEMFAAICINAFIISVMFVIATNGSVSDTLVINGEVTKKDIHRFSCPTNTMNPCENSYTCNCRTVYYTGTCTSYSNGKTRSYSCRKSRIKCDTCYVYPWEQNWWVYSNINADWKIRRVDRQGAQEPKRYAEVNIGDPVSKTQSYTNYVQGASESLFHEDSELEEKYSKIIPEYPINIHDYYKINRIVKIGDVKLLDENKLNEKLSFILGKIGPVKELNSIIVVSNNVPLDISYAVRKKWQGFNKNDLVIFIGLENNIVNWVNVLSWSKNEMVNVAIRDEILKSFDQQPLTDYEKLISIIKDNSMQYYVRKPMAEFEYLKNDIVLPMGVLITMWTFSILGTMLLCFLCYKYDIFQVENKPRDYSSEYYKRNKKHIDDFIKNRR